MSHVEIYRKFSVASCPQKETTCVQNARPQHRQWCTGKLLVGSLAASLLFGLQQVVKCVELSADEVHVLPAKNFKTTRCCDRGEAERGRLTCSASLRQNVRKPFKYHRNQCCRPCAEMQTVIRHQPNEQCRPKRRNEASSLDPYDMPQKP